MFPGQIRGDQNPAVHLEYEGAIVGDAIKGSGRETGFTPNASSTIDCTWSFNAVR
jgi:hypothetical protein